MKSITVRCPGTVANLVCGFDILGTGVNDPYDRMTVHLTDKPGRDDYQPGPLPAANGARTKCRRGGVAVDSGKTGWRYRLPG